MGISFKDIRSAGGIGAFCLQYQRYKGGRNPWDRVREWAQREFPTATTQTIEACIKRAKASCDLASRVMRSKPDREFDHKTEADKQR